MKKHLVLGDSHAKVFGTNAMKRRFPNDRFEVVPIVGATVSGLENPNAKTKAIWSFLDAINESDADDIITLMGEVDTGFVIWYRAKKYAASVQEMFERAVKSYSDFLVMASHVKPVICISTPLPTIGDSSVSGVGNARKEVTATQKERTTLTLSFNETMRQFCEQSGIRYISLDEQSMGEDGVVKQALMNKNRNDHHYSTEAYVDILAPALAAAI